MAVESRRGCGFRKVGCIYIEGEGIVGACDRLPIEVGACPVCGMGHKFSRAPIPINAFELWGGHSPCRDIACFVCTPPKDISYLWGVGEKYYSPQTFITEAVSMGVSKKIAQIPKDLKINVTAIFLVHKKAVFAGMDNGNLIYKAGVFYAFRPTRITQLLWESERNRDTEKKLRKRGIEPTYIPDGDKDHA